MAAPQLRLEVSLNLVGFRNEVRKLTQVAQSEFNPLLTVKVNTQDYRAQLKALEKIKPVIKIEDSQIDAARARIGTLNKSLATLRRATATPIEIKLKYVEAGKPSSTAARQIGQAVSGRIRADEAAAQLKSKKDLVAARNMMIAASIPVGDIGRSRSLETYRKSIVEGMTKAGEQSIAGLTAGFKNGESKVAQAAKGVGEGGLRALKDFWGIASPSRVFKQIGEFAVDGLELGFLNGLKDFKNKSVDEIRKITALLKFELAKVSNVAMAPGMSRSTGSRGSDQFMSPIGPLPEGSREPWAFSQYRYQPFMAQPGQTRGANVPPMRTRFPFAEAPSIMGTTTSPSMFGASFPALPSAGMTGGNAVRQAQLQSRMAAAYARSAAREASVLGESQMYASVSGQVPLGNTAPRLPAGNKGGALALRNAGAQTPLSLDYYKNAFKYSEALKVADASVRNFSASQIPLIGGIKNLAGEFGQATKQVLIYGTAYKGLAFLTSLPGQILNAAKSQQQFANGLKVATQDTGTFGKELLYVDNVQRAFGLNLETTRAGFTRLYASMAPTGFDSGSIEKLFTGISAATASLQLTPDKAERVIYAFGQMASKGQIMSEELKGQLGDVLPGALAIFSKAAGMSVKEFSKAMEDGEFVGNRFREVFAKVSDELMNRFGTGAQAAGRSLQGLVNTVGGDFQRVLESFSPLANSAAQAILGPLGGSLKQLALSAQIATGEIERVFVQLKESQQDLQDLRTSAGTDGIVTAEEASQIKAAEQNVAALTARYKSLQKAASDPAIAKQAEDITKFTEELAKAGTFVMNVAKTIGGILAPALNFLGTNLTTVISLITSFYIGFQTARLAATALMGALLLYRTLSAILGFGPAALSANALAAAFSGLGVAATGAQVRVIGLRVALTALVATTVVGAVVAGIVAIAGAFATMRDRAKEASQSSRDAAKAAIEAAQTGGTAQAAMSVQTILGESRKAAAARKALEAIQERSTPRQRSGVEPIKISIEEAVALKGSALTEKMVRPARGGQQSIQALPKGDFESVIRQFGSVAGQQDLSLREAKSALATAQTVAKEIGLDKPTPGATPPETPDEDKKKTSLESYYSLQDTLAKNAADFAAAQTEEEFRHKIELLEMYYDIQETRANAYQRDAIKFEREMVMIEARRQEARLKAQLDVQRAQASVAGGAPGSSAGGTGAIFGDTGRTFNAAGFVHGHFQNQDREALVKDTVEVVMGLLSKGVSPELGSGARFTSGMNAKQVEALVRQGIGSHKQYASGVGAVDIFMPKGTRVPVPVSGIQNLRGAAGVTGSLPRGSQLMHLDPASTMSAPTGGGAPGKVTPSAKRNAVAEQKTLQASIAKTAIERMADAKAVQEQIVALEKYRASAFPTIEQETQNKLLAKRNELFRSGMTDERIDQEIKLYDNQQRGAAALAVVQKLYDGNIIKLDKYNELMAVLNNDIATQNVLLGQNASLMAQAKFDQTMKGIRGQIDMARALTPEQEMRTQIAQEGYTGTEAESIFQERKTLQSAQKLKADMQGIAGAIGDSFGNAFKGVITGSMTAQEALAGFFQSVADSFADMVANMIAEYLKMALIKGIMSIVGNVPGGFGGAFGASGPSFNAGAFSGPALSPGAAFGGAGVESFSGAFSSGAAAFNPAAFSIPKFANGGVVTGPTLGMVGEGRYNEAVIPLPDGKSVPVQLSGGDGGNQVNTNITVNVSNGQAQSNATGSNSSELGRKLEGAVKQVIVGELRPGGLLASR
jgi:tape measure domain-containing protein